MLRCVGGDIASIGMFGIKPRERQLHGGAAQPGCNLWGGALLPSVPASAGQSHSSPGALLTQGLAGSGGAPRAAAVSIAPVCP